MSALDGIRQRVEAHRNHGTPGAAAPKDRDRLLDALDAVLALHTPVEVFEYDDMNGVFKLDADGEQTLMATLCTECTPDEALESIGDCEYAPNVFNGETSWPCPTVAAVYDALGQP